MISKIVSSDFEGLNRFAKAIMGSGGMVVKVGILAKKNARTDSKVAGNADIGAVHEFGSFSRKIPARSWLRMPLQTLSEEIIKEASRGADFHLSKGNFVAVLCNLGIACENAVQRAFVTSGFGSWKKLKSREGMPLIDTGQLRRSVTSAVGKPS